MHGFGVAASIVVGLVLCAAAFTKLRTGRGWESQGRDLGVPLTVLPVVPWIELGLGALLVVRLAWFAASVAAIGLLVTFTGIVLMNLARGRRPVCACFGSLGATPIGPWHVWRNVALIVLAVVGLVASVA